MSINQFEYIVQDWASVRRNEMVPIPDRLPIHPSFLVNLGTDEFETAFRLVWNLFDQILGDIVSNPAEMGMPLQRIDEVSYFSSAGRQSRFAPTMPLKLLNGLLKYGSLENNACIVDIPIFKKNTKFQHIASLFRILSNYGFVFDGIQSFRLTPNTTELIVTYPDHPAVIPVLFLVARKAESIQSDLNASEDENCHDLFCEWNYQLLSNEMGNGESISGCGYLADKMQDSASKEFVYTFHEVMENQGYFWRYKSWNEGPGIAYYEKESVMKRKGPYTYQVLSWKGGLRLFLRLRNAENCFEYVASSSEHIKELFRASENGCKNHWNGTCKMGVAYDYEGQPRWKCGCWHAPFEVHPIVQEIPSYLKLVELGRKR